LGGAGFIVLTLSLISQSSSRLSFLLYSAESTGERLKSTIIETTRLIWKVYLGITLFLFLFLVVGTLILLPEYSFADTIFDSINHAMAGMSTGGFSTLDDSIAGYHSKGMEILYLFPMILGSFSLTFYVKVIYHKQYSQIWKDIQTRSLILLFILGSILLSYMLSLSGKISEPFRVGVFQFVSALSTTGWQTSDIHTWDSASVSFIVIFGMVIGGAFGATVGGLKIIRVLVLIKGLFWRVNSYFTSENSIKVVQFNNTRLLPEEMNKEITSAATFIFIYFIFLGLGTIITYYTAGVGYTMKDALFESASAQGTVGLSCGITNPSMSPILEITYIIQMWMGRLEIIPILILFRTMILGTKPKVV
jgi:trk system potassium uptake protein TrkH